jgi:aminopeptidase N
LVLDFKGKELTRIVQNGNVIANKLLDGFIYLEVEGLVIGSNRVEVHYSCKYDNDGSGCVSFIDPSEKQYISTQFAPYYANRVFPCFDQPDLKAKMRLSVICPVDWKKVLSNETALAES